MTELKNSITKHSLRLLLFAAGAAVVVGLVHEITRDEIAKQQRRAEQEALFQVMPPSLQDNDILSDTMQLDPGGEAEFTNLELLGLTGPGNAHIARRAGRVSGVILPVEVHDGYNGDIRMLVGIRADGVIAGVRVVEHRETPGLGDKIELRVSDWIRDFEYRSLGNPPAEGWTVKKNGGEFDQFAGATITPRAVVNGVRDALFFFEANKDRLLEDRR